jgi:hypothetical protein
MAATYLRHFSDGHKESYVDHKKCDLKEQALKDAKYITIYFLMKIRLKSFFFNFKSSHFF